MNLTDAHAAIALSSIFMTRGPDIDLPAALITLVDAYMEGNEQYDEFVFDRIGEFTFAPLGDLIVGAYWALTEWHAGQYSPEYAAMCALGKIFKPGMSSMSEDDPAWEVYTSFCGWFASRVLH